MLLSQDPLALIIVGDVHEDCGVQSSGAHEPD